MRLTDLTSHALIARLDELLSSERRTIVDELLCLAEIERRGLHTELSCSTLFAYCTRRLKMTKSAAWRRTTAAGMLARWPVIADYLRDGRLCLATLVLLRDVIEDEPIVLDRAAGKTEDEVRELVASMRPRDVKADLFTRLAVITPASSNDATSLDTVTTGGGFATKPNDVTASAPARERNQLEIARARQALRAATVEPLSAEYRRMHVTVSRQFMEDLEKVKALLSHSMPGATLEEILHACLKKTIAVCEKRRSGSNRPRPRKVDTVPKGRTIPAAVRREVWKRDAGRCTFVGTDGTRCNETHFIQFHHIVPFERGGPPTVENLTLHCAAHNRHEAEQEYGEAHVREARERRMAARRARASS